MVYLDIVDIVDKHTRQTVYKFTPDKYEYKLSTIIKTIINNQAYRVQIRIKMRLTG